MVLLVLGFWPSMCMPTIDYFYIWTTCIEGVKATTPLHCMMRIHFYPTANPLWDVSFFGAVSPEFHMLTVVVLLYVRWGLSIINAVGYCRAQTDIFSVRETVCQSSWISSVWDRFWNVSVLFQIWWTHWENLFLALWEIIVKTHWIFLCLWEEIKNNFSILHFLLLSG